MLYASFSNWLFKWKPALILIFLFTISLSVVTYIRYEPTEVESACVVQAEVLAHSFGGTGKSGASPFFFAKLFDGSAVKVRDYGDTPTTYRGLAYLVRMKGKNTGIHLYRIVQEKAILEKKLPGCKQ